VYTRERVCVPGRRKGRSVRFLDVKDHGPASERRVGINHTEKEEIGSIHEGRKSTERSCPSCPGSSWRMRRNLVRRKGERVPGKREERNLIRVFRIAPLRKGGKQQSGGVQEKRGSACADSLHRRVRGSPGKSKLKKRRDIRLKGCNHQSRCDLSGNGGSEERGG